MVIMGRNNEKSINGKELFEYLQIRFDMTKQEAFNSMVKHNQDTSGIENPNPKDESWKRLVSNSYCDEGSF